MYRPRVCVPGNPELNKEILEEAHCASYAMQPGRTKMYHTMKPSYWWLGMKRDVDLSPKGIETKIKTDAKSYYSIAKG